MARLKAVLGSAIFLIVAPGTVAGLVPWLISHWDVRPGPWVLRVAGALLIVAGGVTLLAAFARFAWQGLGTPAPIAPTRQLVTRGSYAHVRNPMYLAVIATIVGQAMLLPSLPLLGYAAAVAAAMVSFVRLYEEPHLLATYPQEYADYRLHVPGWIPRLRPWSPH